MNWKNKTLVKSLRILFGALMAFSGISGLIAGGSAQGVPEAMLAAFATLWSTGILQMIKLTEAIAGLMLVFNFLPALAVIFLAPVAVGIIVFNAMMAPQFILAGIVVALFECYFGYVYWEKYKALFKR